MVGVVSLKKVIQDSREVGSLQTIYRPQIWEFWPIAFFKMEFVGLKSGMHSPVCHGVHHLSPSGSAVQHI